MEYCLCAVSIVYELMNYCGVLHILLYFKISGPTSGNRNWVSFWAHPYWANNALLHSHNAQLGVSY